MIFDKSEMSLEEIAEIEDPAEGYEELDAWIWNNGREDEEYDENPAAIKEYIAIWWMDTEVINGGFHQFLWNYTGRYAPDALSGLQKIGAEKTAKLLESAMGLISSENFPLDDNERTDIMDSFDKSREEFIDRLSADYYAEPDNLKVLLFDYFRNHTDCFRISTAAKSEIAEVCPFCERPVVEGLKTCDNDDCIEQAVKLKI